MPWRGAESPGEFPTLGFQVADYIEDSCAIPDGDRAGDPYLLTDEMLKFLLWFYRLHPVTGEFAFARGGQLVRPQKWGKGPFSAAIICAEASGPVLFDGWDADGEPVGRPWATPWVQVTAVSEDQTDNVWRALVPMIRLGSLKADIPDTGETRINLQGGGRIEPVTSSASSRLGQRVTLCLQDETHSWNKHNGGRKLADNQRRNLAGMGGRFLETTNAWDPIEESVAQETYESKAPGVFIDDVEPGPGSIKNKRERRRMLKEVYGDSCKDGPLEDGRPRWKAWVKLDRIDGEIEELLPRDPAQAERYFLNRKRAEEGSAFDIARWAELARPDIVVPDQALITIGVDGARFDDALAVIGCDVRQGHEFEIGIWEVPPGAPEMYQHPFHEVDGAMLDVFERYDPWRVYVDDQWIEILLEKWQGRWGADRVVPWQTHRPKPMAFATRAFASAIAGGDLTHDGSSDFARHIKNARRQMLNVYDDQRRRMWSVTKDRPGSPRKIDAAPAAILAWEARGDAIAAGALTAEPDKKRSGGIW